MRARPVRTSITSADRDPRPAAPLEEERARQDELLVERLRADPDATAPLLYDHFADDVNRLVWRLLGADPDHNDIVQQVFYRVIVHVHRLRDPTKLRSWIYSIAVNTVYSELRRRDLRRLFSRETATEVELHPDMVREVEARDLLRHARGLMDRIPARERVVFVLHFIEGCTLAEIGEICGFSLATAKRRLARANDRFERLLQNYPELLRLVQAKDAHE